MESTAQYFHRANPHDRERFSKRLVREAALCSGLPNIDDAISHQGAGRQVHNGRSSAPP
jgi:hypothetical protein